MPRTVAEILDQADELAAPLRSTRARRDRCQRRRGTPPRSVHTFQARAEAERTLADAVSVTRPKGTRGPRSAPWSVPQARPHANVTDARSPNRESTKAQCARSAVISGDERNTSSMMSVGVEVWRGAVVGA